MQDDERQEWINKRAYSLWEADGRQHGKDREHWEQAVRERDEFEKVVLPEHLLKKRNSVEADAETRKAVASTRQPRSKREAKGPLSRPTAI